METLRIGLSGCGYFGREAARIIAGMNGMSLAAVYCPSGEGARSVAEAYDCVAAESPEALAESGDVDAIVVASPNYAHAETVIQAAKAGKHVFCEKPLALNVRAADDAIRACREAGVVLMDGYMMRYFDGFAQMKSLIDSGAIGKPLVAHAERTAWDEAGASVSWKKIQRLSGGHLFHHIHEIDLLQWLMGPVRTVYGAGGNFANSGSQADEDDVLLLTMHFANGTLGTLQIGSAFRLGGHAVKVNGTAGALLLDLKQAALFIHGINGEVKQLPLFNDPESQQEMLELQRRGPKHGKPTDRPPRYFTETLPKELHDFQEVIAGRWDSVPQTKRDLFGGGAGRAGVAVAEAALRSIASGLPVQLG